MVLPYNFRTRSTISPTRVQFMKNGEYFHGCGTRRVRFAAHVSLGRPRSTGVPRSALPNAESESTKTCAQFVSGNTAILLRGVHLTLRAVMSQIAAL